MLVNDVVALDYLLGCIHHCPSVDTDTNTQDATNITIDIIDSPDGSEHESGSCSHITNLLLKCETFSITF